MKSIFEKKAEILSPAGSYESLLAAVEGGCDAVYLGSEKFSARASAQNFNDDGLLRAVRYCHAHGVAVYLALNTLLFDRELEDAVTLARTAEKIGIDALIVADMGLIRRLRQECPNLVLHVSTQAGIHTKDGIKMLSELGCERVVLPRELSSDELKEIADYARQNQMECEAFVHGAHCVSFSGQCLFSAMVGGRSGNRGECAQPCRLPYDGAYPLSLKDLSLALHVRELCEMGIDSFKIEGRLKAPYYVYEVTRTFRRLLNENRNASKNEMKRLAHAFSRGGSFSDGYFKDKTDCMTAVRTDEDKENSRLAEDGYSPKESKEKITFVFRAQKGKPLSLRATCRIGSVTVTGAVPEDAKSAAATEDALYERLAKLGDTPFTLDREASQIEIQGELFIPVSQLNELRRRACDLLLNVPLRHHSEGVRTQKASGASSALRAYDAFPSSLVLTARGHQARTVRSFFEKDATPPLLFTSFLALFEDPSLLPIVDGVCLPPIITDRERVIASLKEWRAGGLRYAMVENVTHTPIATECDLIPYGGLRLNLTNRSSCEFFHECGGAYALLSPELNLSQSLALPFGIPLIYGRIPLMLTERCFIRENFSCERCDKAAFSDRMGVNFPLMREWEHRNVILNSRPTYMLDKRKEMERKGFCGYGLLFSCEDERETLRILNAYRLCAPPDGEIRRMK